jgi:hypothetical protein
MTSRPSCGTWQAESRSRTLARYRSRLPSERRSLRPSRSEGSNSWPRDRLCLDEGGRNADQSVSESIAPTELFMATEVFDILDAIPFANRTSRRWRFAASILGSRFGSGITLSIFFLRATPSLDSPAPGDTRDGTFCLTKLRIGCGEARARSPLQTRRRASAPTAQAIALRTRSTGGR